MDADRRRVIFELLEQAVDLGPAAREAYLSRSCGSDKALRAEVQSLLTACDDVPSLLNASAVDMYSEVIGSQEASSLVGRQVGPYQLVRFIASGGMGAVYLATSPDLPPRKEVAIKLIRRRKHTPDTLRRFRIERQALALLHHPHIAAHIDGGITDTGVPYLVMEYVDGPSIDKYCDQKLLSTNERLELFRTVCSGVAYAHRNLIVHRDLKPNNILVTSDGTPKLLDFGIAKVLEPNSAGQSGETTTRNRILTPEYASPEHIRGEAITTASDVYSLGVILYGLLTGHSPYRFKSRIPHEIERTVCEQDPEKPSTAILRTPEPLTQDEDPYSRSTPESVSKLRSVTPAGLRRQLAGDLETIILKALEKEPARRYQSALAFAEDIDRYFSKRPILARSPSGIYEFRKIVARNRLPFSLAVVFVMLTLAFGLWMTALRVRARGAEHLARNRLAAITEAHDQLEAEARKSQLEAENAWQITELLQELIASQIPLRLKQRNGVSGAILDQLALRIEAELGDFPEMQAALFSSLGITYAGLGLFAAAEKCLKSALDLNSSEYGEEHVAVAESLYDLGCMYDNKGDPAAVVPLYERRLEILRNYFGPDHVRVARAVCNLAAAQLKIGRQESAVALFRRALDSLPMEDPLFTVALQGLSEALNAGGDWDAGRQVRREAVRRLQVASIPLSRRMDDAIGTECWMLRDEGRLVAADQLAEVRLEYLRNEFGKNHLRLVDARFALAILRLDQGDFDSAEQLARGSLSISRESLVGPTTRSVRALSRLGGVLWARGDYGQAEAFMRTALEVVREISSEDSLFMWGRYNALAVVLRDEGEFAEAEALFDKALVLLRQHYGEQHRNVANVINNRARLDYLRHDYVSAESFIRDALSIREHLLPAGHREIAESMMVLGMILTETGDLESAECLLRDAVEMRASAFPQPDHWLVAEANSALATCLAQIGEWDQAELLLLQSLSIFQSRLHANHKLNRQTVQRLIDLYRIRNESQRAIQGASMPQSSESDN